MPPRRRSVSSGIWLVPALALLCASSSASAAPRLKVAVLELKATGVEKAVTDNLLEIFASGIHELGCCSVVSGAEISAMLGFEKQRQLLNCSETSCVTDLAGALGVDYLTLGTVGRVGDTFVVSLKLVDARHATVVGRFAQRVEGRVDRLLDTVERGVVRLFEPVVKAVAPSVAIAPAAIPSAQSAAAEPSRRTRWLSVSAAAAALVAASAGAYFGLSARSANDEWRAATTPSLWADAKERASAAAGRATAAWSASGVFLAGGAGVFFFTDF